MLYLSIDDFPNALKTKLFKGSTLEVMARVKCATLDELDRKLSNENKVDDLTSEEKEVYRALAKDRQIIKQKYGA
jgi:hypothetical protein